MICDSYTLLCEIPFGSLILVVGLAALGVSVALFGFVLDAKYFIEDLQRWWAKRKPE